MQVNIKITGEIDASIKKSTTAAITKQIRMKKLTHNLKKLIKKLIKIHSFANRLFDHDLIQT